MNPDLEVANSMYKFSLNPLVSQSTRLMCLEKAEEIYEKELKKSSKSNRPSLMRNIGVSCLRYAEILDSKTILELNFIYSKLNKAVFNLTWAWADRPQDRYTEWGQKVEQNILDCFKHAFFRLDNDDLASQIILNFQYLDQIDELIYPGAQLDYFRVIFGAARAQFLHDLAVKSLELLDFKSTDRILEYCHKEIDKLSKYRKSQIPEKLSVWILKLNQDFAFIKGSCDSVRFRYQGDKMFESYELDPSSKRKKIDKIWAILDIYKLAVLSCQPGDVENKAIASSRQARIFDKILNDRTQAKHYYQEAITLGKRSSKDLSGTIWFFLCELALKRYKRDEEKKEKDAEISYFKKLKKWIEELHKIVNNFTNVELLKYIYKSHPVKSVEFAFDERQANSGNMKKMLIRAISHYHPDKQVNFGRGWKVLCEEITKYLTARYEELK